MEKSNVTALLILLIGILTLFSCSSDGGSNNANSGGGDEILSCLWDYGSDGKTCVKIYGFQTVPEGDKCGGGGSGKSVKSCPSSPDKTCLMIGTSQGKEYNMDWFVYGSSFSSQSCEFWVEKVGLQPARLR